jgi:hypothetical protein
VKLLFHGENTTFRVDGPDGRFVVRVHRSGYQSSQRMRSLKSAVLEGWCAGMKTHSVRRLRNPSVRATNQRYFEHCLRGAILRTHRV